MSDGKGSLSGKSWFVRLSDVNVHLYVQSNFPDILTWEMSSEYPSRHSDLLVFLGRPFVTSSDCLQ